MRFINKEEANMEDRKLTINEVLEMTAGILEGIEVPMKHMETIGVPIANAIHNIRACIQAKNMAAAKPNEKAED